MLAAFDAEQCREIQAETDAGGVAQTARNRIAGGRGTERVEEAGRGGVRFLRSARAVLQALADDCPVAQIFRGTPGDAHDSAGKAFERLADLVEKLAGSRGAGVIRKNHQKSAATGRAQKQRRQLQFREQSARQDVAQQRHPPEARFKRTIIFICRSGKEKFIRPQQSAL